MNKLLVAVSIFFSLNVSATVIELDIYTQTTNQTIFNSVLNFYNAKYGDQIDLKNQKLSIHAYDSIQLNADGSKILAVTVRGFWIPGKKSSDSCFAYLIKYPAQAWAIIPRRTECI